MTRSDTARPAPAAPQHRHDPDRKVPGTFRFDLDAAAAAANRPTRPTADLAASARPLAVTPFGAPPLRDVTPFAHLPETPLVLELRRRALTREPRA